MIIPSTSATFYAQAISDVIRQNVALTRPALQWLQLDEHGVVKILDAFADHSHQATGYRFSENGPIKDRVHDYWSRRASAWAARAMYFGVVTKTWNGTEFARNIPCIQNKE